MVDGDGPPTTTLVSEVTLGETLVLVSDAVDGTQARRFAALLAKRGANQSPPEFESAPLRATFRITIRSVGGSSDTRARAAELEREADVVLGSVRPAFASWLATRLLGA